jgi:spore germination cell wall hydrolase CwlJ-like protein
MATVLTSSRPGDGLRTSAVRLKGRLAALWRTHPRGTVGVGLLGLVGAAAITTTTLFEVNSSHGQQVAPPAPPPMTVRPIAADQAIKVNSEIPVAVGPNPAAAPFIFKGNAATRAQALTCLASAEYYEAGNQDEDGARAVAQVVLNRVRHPAFPNAICSVVYQGSTRPTGCQFTFTCDGSLNRRPDADGWRRAMRVAEAALNGYVYTPVGWATHYHADYVVPDWASTMPKNAIVGAHLFYRWAGQWGQPQVFARIYAGHEPSAEALRSAALAAVHVIANQPGSLAAVIRDIPGAEPLKLAPSLRGDKRVAVRFNVVARKASEEAPHQAYTNKFEVSDNLKWSLSSDTVAENQQPLGRTTPAPKEVSAGGASASR